MKTQAIIISVLLGLFSTPVLADHTTDHTVADLVARVAALEAKLATVSTVKVNGQPTVRFTGVNVQIVNGTKQQTASSNGRGNLILGYDLDRNDATYFCSDGAYTTSGACSGAGGLWAVSHKSGSHYLVIGDFNNYSQYGGVVAGSFNTGNGAYASVSGGLQNTASGPGTSVSGGGTTTPPAASSPA